MTEPMRRVPRAAAVPADDVERVQVALLDAELDAAGHAVQFGVSLRAVGHDGHVLQETLVLSSVTAAEVPQVIATAIGDLLGDGYRVRGSDLAGFDEDRVEAEVRVQRTAFG